MVLSTMERELKPNEPRRQASRAIYLDGVLLWHRTVYAGVLLWLCLLPAVLEAQMIVELLVLGTGKGATAVYQGSPSSSFVLIVDGKCRLLVDIGIGVAQECITSCGYIPDHVFVTHNHTDHSGELPVVLAVEQARGRKLSIISGPLVEEVLKAHRLHELLSTEISLNEFARWTRALPGNSIQIDADIQLKIFRACHQEPSYGFLLYVKGTPILGFSGDSGYDEGFYRQLLDAPWVLLDGRAEGNSDHAEFTEINDFARQHPRHQFLVTGHGEDPGTASPLHLVHKGDRITLWEKEDQ